MRVEIRCCCNPAQLLGWVELRRDHIREGEEITFTLYEPEPLELPDAEADFWAHGRAAMPEVLRLPVAFWWHNLLVIDQLEGGKINRESGLALKSNDTPIEKLRRIPGFREAQ